MRIIGSDLVTDNNRVALQNAINAKCWRNFTYYLECIVYFGMLTLLSLPLCFAFYYPSVPPHAAIPFSIAIAAVLDWSLYKSRQSILNDSWWLKHALEPDFFS